MLVVVAIAIGVGVVVVVCGMVGSIGVVGEAVRSADRLPGVRVAILAGCIASHDACVLVVVHAACAGRIAASVSVADGAAFSCVAIAGA